MPEESSKLRSSLRYSKLRSSCRPLRRGQLPTRWREPVRALKNVVLPQFGYRPRTERYVDSIVYQHFLCIVWYWGSGQPTYGFSNFHQHRFVASNADEEESATYAVFDWVAQGRCRTTSESSAGSSPENITRPAAVFRMFHAK